MFINSALGTKICLSRAEPQAVCDWLPTAAAPVPVWAKLWWTERHWGRTSPSTSVSPTTLSSH
jgi:hypothetical protein